jgi:hypothetical protein
MRNRRLVLGAAAAVALIAAVVWVLTLHRLAPIPNDTQAAAKFLLTACGNSAHNLLAVAQLAERRRWASMIAAPDPENAPLRLTGMWRVDEDGRSYTVTAGLAPGDHTACQVGFEHPKPDRNDFFAAVSGALTLKVAGDFPGANWHMETYQIENLAPKNVTLLFVSSSHGAVYHAAVMGN